MTGAAARQHTSGLLSIGQVLARLQDDFTDLSPSKLRFLEEQGLVTPERTKSGYRKFSQAHIERLRLILTLQRDHYLPLKVIAEVLEELDQGRDPIIPGAAPRSASSILAPKRVLSSEELCRSTGANVRFLGEAIAAGLLPAAEVFPHDAVAQLTALMRLAERGITPRHLRSLRLAAEREAELIARAVSTRGVKQGTPAGAEDALEFAGYLDTVRSGVLRRRVSGA
ncbi:MerR-like DNA binding protein [Leucobacter luti]|uniref:MerR-like DNA binding protein n=1 Tax=Leucobacter luti TaxID=340320 RepID=A0A4R6RZS3_9MICO|nr:MerR family transcriptional regulator [Leucobacter luti]MCW2287550.1 DNA-binding transcriptional MerR regulator [Leucobacter luti]TCK46283.1 MerR-like DNA binding protein [Leucobacter luti]TDP92712.1 MerR-like DNA binding protein [Leucobacter luti]